jgi:hypothetical protein
MDLEIELFLALNGIIDNQGSGVEKNIYDWTISSPVSLKPYISIRYNADEGEMLYGFYVTVKDDEIIFENYHRKVTEGFRNRGIGTRTLNTLETTIQRISSSRKKQSVVIFYGANCQLDTKNWLGKLGYTFKETATPGFSKIHYKLIAP